ncbi:hypothetical protein GPECTOR_33g634 [Gonium pectorale]|uniref:GPI inositol-deacylase n=1 Tax=Gonium pectorale TaxID=33097 RepID=A0A150GD41_GONPE|nr:hypothetical protein GPECTOR_33g634 [Gonium pectorale]|eukprot:KXZ47752.1 hypothetical protein GPECTOR_33g634 [Gonium pectorale]
MSGRGMLALALAATAAVLTWCALHIHNEVLPSQQPCEMSYVHAAYSPVDLTRSNHTEDGADSAAGASPARAQPPSPWAAGVAGAAQRLADAAATLADDGYRLWRYTGDGAEAAGELPLPAARTRSGGGDGSSLALPVLFIPGNGGSHEMGRSLAAESARRVSRLGPRARTAVRLDWYLADLGGEWSAFDGAILGRQVNFTLAAMRHIARAHGLAQRRQRSSGPSSSASSSSSSGSGGGGGALPAPGAGPAAAGAPPGAAPLRPHPGLIVVGHSMGGVVAAEAIARAAEESELGPSLAALLLTLGSPHARAPLPGHPSLTAFYRAAAARARPVVPVVGLAGGLADLQVATSLTQPGALAPEAAPS